jgi:hypothetical protein
MPKIISDLRKTLETAFSVGGKGGGARAFEFYNGFLGRLLWNPTANRDITVPDAEGTVVLQNNGRIDGLSPAIANGQAVPLEQVIAVLPDLAPIDTALITAAQTAFPAITVEHATAIAVAARWAALDSTLSATQIIDLLGRTGNLIYDFRRSYGLHFQDAAETQPVTANGQNLSVVRPWKGTNKFTADSLYPLPTTDNALGVLFPQTGAVMRLTTERSDIRFAMTGVEAQANPVGWLSFLYGGTANFDFHADTVNLFNSVNAPLVVGGQIWIDGRIALNSETGPTATGLIAMRPTGAVQIGSIADDRGSRSNPSFQTTFYGRRRFDFFSSEVFTLAESNALVRFGLQYAGYRGTLVSSTTSGEAASITAVTLNFGSVPVYSKVFTISHSGAQVSQNVIMVPSAKMPAGVALDELEMDALTVSAYVSAADTITALVTANPGPVSGQRAFNYQVL